MKKNNQKTEWNLALLYPKGDTDPRIEQDVQNFERLYSDFASKYTEHKEYLSQPAALLEALTDLEHLNDKANSRPYMYFHYKHELNSSDKNAAAMMNVLNQRLTAAGNKILFFSLSLGKISAEKQKEFLNDPSLSKYHHFLSVIFNESKHRLSEEGEKILNLVSLPARELWSQHVQKKQNHITVTWKGKKLPLSQIGDLIAQSPTKDRRALQRLYNDACKTIAADAESELNAICIQKKITDELRGFKRPYDSRILDSQNRTETVERLVKVVEAHYSIAHRFYALKAKLLKEKKLTYADRSAAIGRTTTKYPFHVATAFLSETFGAIAPQYRTIFEKYLEQGQIDAFPRTGKSAGAFCSSSTGNPVFVLLNHTDSFNAVSTIAHEMGHAFHSELTQQAQPSIYHDYTMPVAEVASTFFENFAFDALLKTLNPKEQVIALHDKINGSIATIFRQVALFNFENELHLTIRQKGAMSHDEMAKLLTNHMQAYLGPSVKVTTDDGYQFVTWPHIRYFFYVYAYAFGETVSTALYARYKKDASYLGKVEEFMKAGSSKSAERIFEDIGIPVSDKSFFEEALQEISREIDQLEEAAKKILKK